MPQVETHPAPQARDFLVGDVLKTRALFPVTEHLFEENIFTAGEQASGLSAFVYNDIFFGIAFSRKADDLVEPAFVVSVCSKFHVTGICSNER